ncbi:MAG: acyltransferase family protein [Prevotella sp.]|nr:acyltransferase family protein [Prevotella sp.]
MAETIVRDNRLAWIDWMKALGIYLIVLGHFYSVGEKFIYVFHVPLFFVISGFLNKKETDGHVFWRKLWYNLAVPMLLMAVTNFVYHCILQLFKGSFAFVDLYWFVRNLTFGMVAGLDTLWFVYTLILLKVIHQYCRSDIFFYLLIVVMLGLACIYNKNDLSGFPFFISEPNAIVDLLMAYPFFAFGVLMRNYKEKLNAMNNKAVLIAIFACGLLLVSLCSTYNGYVGLFGCNYGGNIFFFLVGAVAGTVMIWALSKLLGFTPKAITVVSQGTIIILGFHKMLIDLARAFFNPSLFDIIFATLILLLFIPLIISIENYFPLMAGKYRIKNKNG